MDVMQKRIKIFFGSHETEQNVTVSLIFVIVNFFLNRIQRNIRADIFNMEAKKCSQKYKQVT